MAESKRRRVQERSAPADDPIPRLLDARLTRRSVLGAAMAGLAATAFGGSPTPGAAAGRRAGRAPRPAGGVALEGPAFTLGVASGDPRPDRVVLWTRLAPFPLEGGGMPDAPVEVAWDVATDDGFRDVVRKGVATARPSAAHSLHVDVRGLEPASDYFYRFRLGDDISPVGRTRTLPRRDASPERLRLALASCQDYGTGYYTSYRDLADRDVDVVLFLGDYIYEHPIFAFDGRANPTTEAVTLDDYRARYALYHTDPDLQAAHHAVPWVATWDDHDVSNNYAGDTTETGASPDQFRARRAAAYRAWYEHVPVRLAPPRGPDVRLYREFAFGDLARFFVLDVRQHAAEPPCRDVSEPLTDQGPTCPEREDPGRSILGREQQRWLLDALGRADERWSVLAQQVMMAGLNVNPADGPPEYYLDSWDGYPASRRRVLDGLGEADVASPIVLTGDYHASFVADLRRDPFDTDGRVVATEFVGPAISSIPFATDFREQNPHVRYFEPRNGYATCTVERDQWTTEFRYVTDVRDPQAAVEPGAAFVVERGRPEATPA
jgi:alkaline phosphatase D